ncbi:hypothetical protein BpHYR1_042358 [Brachionus plicatilis]|uniref:Uncharacterized protein n=1 Tax=Brachionus plicatilis TaxID=10195 RepID=A0A3M7SUX2_BRAPC|nr:hypothetical protein BpHYR1_042358 [Brachionus plicatilis]
MSVIADRFVNQHKLVSLPNKEAVFSQIQDDNNNINKSMQILNNRKIWKEKFIFPKKFLANLKIYFISLRLKKVEY